MSRSRGRPEIQFDREMIDTAKETLGLCVFAARAATRLARKYKLGRDSAYRLVDLARDEIVKGMTDGGAGDPGTAVVAFLMAVVADAKVGIRSRIDAASALTRMLGLARRVSATENNEVEDFLAALATRQAARQATVG